MEDSIFIIFIAFGFLWIFMGIAAVMVFLRSGGEQNIRFGKWGLLVALPILIAILITLVYGAVRY